MPIVLAIAGRSPVTISDEHIPIGSDPCCSVILDDSADIKPIHAVIKEVSGRWLIEACDVDLVTVGDGEPGKRHWLKPGDVIQLSSKCPPIIFEPKPQDDELLPEIPRFADSSLPARPSKPAAPLTDAGLLSDTVDIATPATSTAIPVTKAPKSGTIRSLPPLSSDEVPVLKRTTTATTSPEKDHKNSAAATPRQGSKSDADLPARRAKRSGSSGQIPTRKPTDEEAAADLPVLSRITSYEEEELPLAPRRGRSSDKAEMDWIMNVIFRCVGAGVALLVVWLVVSSVWKMLSQPTAGVPDLSAANNAETTVTTAAVIPVPTNNVPPTVPKPKVPITKEPAGGAHEKSDPASNPTNPTAENVEAEGEKEAGENLAMESDPDEPEEAMAEDPDESKPVETDETETEQTAGGPLSPVLQATEGSLYAVVMQDMSGAQQIHLGTAWAISDRHLVTSASVATELKRLQKKGLIATAMQPSRDWSMRIKNARIHAKYTKAVADTAATHNDKQLEHIQMVRLRHDLAVLDLDAAHQMEETLPFVTKPLKTTTETVYSIVGYPTPIYEGKPPTFTDVGPVQESHSKRMSPVGAKRLKEPVINIKFPPQVQERNWSGSPVLNKDNQVIGIYVQLPPEENGAGKLEKPEYVVVWLGLLKEITTDVFRKSELQPAMDDDR